MKINFVIPCLLGVEGIIADELTGQTSREGVFAGGDGADDGLCEQTQRNVNRREADQRHIEAETALAGLNRVGDAIHRRTVQSDDRLEEVDGVQPRGDGQRDQHQNHGVAACLHGGNCFGG